jgi:HlyD family secretion protein
MRYPDVYIKPLASMAMRPILTVLLLAGLSACGPTEAAQVDNSPPPKVETVRATGGTVEPTLTVSGIVAPYREVGVSAAFNERILDIRVHEGDRVKAGQVLAVLDAEELQASLASAQETAAENQARYQQQVYQSSVNVQQYGANVEVARAALAQAQATFTEAESNLKRYEQLARSGYIADQTLESQRVTVRADQQAVDAAQAQYALAAANAKYGGSAQRSGVESAQIGAAHAAVLAADKSVQQIQLEIGKAVLTAPVDGVVSAINGNVGEYPSGRQLFTIHQDSSMYAMLTASASQVERLHPGEAVSVTTADGAIHTNGVVESVLDQLAPGTTNFIVKVRIPNPGNQWRAGLPVSSRIALTPVRGVVVPNSTFADSMNSSVFVVRNGVVHSVSVHVVSTDGSRSVIDGVTPGESVVRDGQSGVSEGERVGG